MDITKVMHSLYNSSGHIVIAVYYADMMILSIGHV